LINALSIDLEYWYSTELVRKHVTSVRKGDEQIVEAVTPILDLLDRYDTKATFFVVGTVARRYSQVVRTIFEKGHEIASHSYSHLTLHELGKERFEEEISKSIKVLESITGEKPIGFRAPTFSVDNSTRWALEILKRHGFKYDSSVFPVKTRLYGVPNAPLRV